ncbi:MAG TPA: serine/threonine protein kinase [Candidatus Hydrogenedentes bacterium]|nr:serine/threonine protein kinase [Candidatus Hydrogenedentota bacterium]
MWIVNAYLWVIEQPLLIVLRLLSFEPMRLGNLWYVYDGLVTLALAVLLSRVIGRVKTAVRRARKKERLADAGDVAALAKEKADFAASVKDATNLKDTIKALKKSKQYQRLGEICALASQHKAAAKWFRKAGSRKEGALELAKAGKPLKAARILLDEGEFTEAAQLFGESQRFVEAAEAYAKAGADAKSAAAYVAARRFNEASDAYAKYFTDAKRDPAEQLQSAEACWAMVSSASGKQEIAPDLRAKLLGAVAVRFEQAGRAEPAAAAHGELGSWKRAGDLYARAGKLELAVKCMERAGDKRGASHYLGQYHAARKQWAEAAAAYMAAGDFREAGECYASIRDPVHAGNCFERAGLFYRAGVSYVHAERYKEARDAFQKMPENDEHFASSRAILGHCFYQLHDFDRCAATLSNHLFNQPVTTKNKEYFYMLANAYEQIGKLKESQDVFFKISAVDYHYRDVSDRLSNIKSRISMGLAEVGPGDRGTPAGAPAETAIVDMVSNAIGTRYKIERELGRGGMGVVYLAKDTQLERPVALKFLGAALDGSEEFRARFLREARTAAKISHPNIVSIYDVSAQAGKAYIAMEYVDGPDLHRYQTSKGHLPPREAANVIKQACGALGAIHEVGIVHRDIKPDNFLIARGGLVKLGDFGLAKEVGSRFTQDGVVVGTPAYMSPEQVLGNQVDIRTDIYAIGMVLYELLVGEPAFIGRNVQDAQVNQNAQPPRERNADIPEALDAVVMKSIAKKPEERFQTTQELLAALREIDL